MSNVACQVCGNYTIIGYGEDDICPVCFWHDDGIDTEPDAVHGGPNYTLSMTQARKNYRETGAIEERVQAYVRPPTPEELPENN